MASGSSAAAAAAATTSSPVYDNQVLKGEADIHTLRLEIRNWSRICPKGAERFPIQRSQEYTVISSTGQSTTWYLVIDCIYTVEREHYDVIEIAKIKPYIKSSVHPNDIYGSFTVSVINRDGVKLMSGEYALNTQFLTEESEKKAVQNVCDEYDLSLVEFNHSSLGMIFSPARFWNRDRENINPPLVSNDDILRIECELSLAGKVRPVLAECFTKYSLVSLDESALCLKTFNTLRKNEEMTDFFIHCDGKVFPVHKLILSGRSEVFRAMLQPHTKECQEGQVIITDIRAQTMEILLDFIYTGRIKRSLSDLPPFKELAEAANKYLMTGLKHYCLLRVVQRVNVDNVLEIMELVYNLDANNSLKNQVRDFVHRNISFFAENRTLEEFNEIIESRDFYLKLKESPKQSGNK